MKNNEQETDGPEVSEEKPITSNSNHPRPSDGATSHSAADENPNGSEVSPSSSAEASEDRKSTAAGPQRANGEGKSDVHPPGPPPTPRLRRSGRRRKTGSPKPETSKPVQWISTNSLIRKVRENSTWCQLQPAELERMEGWLFDENLGYAKTVERLEKEFGIKTTVGSVGRYYRRRARVRQAEELVEAQLAADGVNSLVVDADSLREAVVKLAGKAALNLANEKPEEIEQLASLTQLLLEAEHNNLRRGRLKLAQQHFDYDKIAATAEDFPKIRAFMESVMKDTSLTEKEKIKKVHDMIFGWKQAANKEWKEQERAHEERWNQI